MRVTARRVRFTAVLAGVVLALTGFSSSHGSHGKSSGGGGCSSSKSTHTTHHTNYGSTNGSTSGTSGGSGGSTATPTPTATPSPTAAPARARIISCAGPDKPYAVVEVTSLLTTDRLISVTVTFKNAGGSRVEQTIAPTNLKKGETAQVKVLMTNPARATDVRDCELGPLT
ncbi:hypothetical protein [Streptomyces sp. NBC_00454]|uniref:hypothetical protein n=1 Tax=Streptomyces sp. NBC_00454 TaxID=2975747 RepID=UPI0030DFA57B